jgi:hypothetical protein
MNGVTHLGAAMVITLCVYKLLSDSLQTDHPSLGRELAIGKSHVQVLQIVRAALCFVLGILSHAFIDIMGRFTYHPPTSNWDDGSLQWAILNIGILTPLLLIYVLHRDIRYLWAMFGGILQDLWDWGLMRAFPGIFPYAILHSATSPLDQLLAPLPSFTYDRWAIAIEVVLMVVLLVTWWRLEKRWPLPPRPRGNVVRSIVGALGIGIAVCLVASIALTPFYPW